jgi:hypothetical protein
MQSKGGQSPCQALALRETKPAQEFPVEGGTPRHGRFPVLAQRVIVSFPYLLNGHTSAPAKPPPIREGEKA